MITSLLSRIPKPHWATYWLSFLNKADPLSHSLTAARHCHPECLLTTHIWAPWTATVYTVPLYIEIIKEAGSNVCHDSHRSHLQGSGGRRWCTAREGDGSIVGWVAWLFVMILGMFRGKSNCDRAWRNLRQMCGARALLTCVPCWFQAVLTSPRWQKP